ncbi:recombinase family protein [Bacillus sp. 2205SS5-2]|uniref:recombinase family protein n=1 Tax=Bacillus sp. 2205SS5-2 TaxID=3109031 RepID=UPI003004A886
MNKTKVAAYCRVSTNSDDQKNSFENQKKFFENMKDDKKYEIVNIYADEGISGVSLKKREQFLQMIFDAGIDFEKRKNNYEFDADNKRDSKFRKILIKDISRFSRNMDIIPLYRSLVKKGVSLVLVNQGLELSKESDEFYLNLLLNFAQQESLDRGEKVRFGLKESAKKGRIKFSRDLFGFKYIAETQKVEIVEEEAKIVRYIFDLYVNKELGVRRITQLLKKQGHKTRAGKFFGNSTVTRMISNQKYCGDMVYFRYDTGTVLNKNATYKYRPEEEWIVHENLIPSIIPREMFYKAQELRKSRGSKTGKFRGVKHANTTYSNIIICGNCGAFYGRNSANGAYFLNCMTKKRFGITECDYPNIKEEEIDNLIDRICKSLMYKFFLYQKNESLELLTNLKLDLLKKAEEETPPEYFQNKKSIQKLSNKKEKLLSLYLEDTINKGTLDKKLKEINEEIEIIENAQFKLSMPAEEIKAHTLNIDKRIKELQNIQIKKVFEKKEIVDLIDKIEISHVYRNADLKVVFKFEQTVNKAITLLDSSRENEEIKKITPPAIYYTIKLPNNIKPRIPENAYVLRDGVSQEEVDAIIKKDQEERDEKYKRLVKE